MVDNSDFERFRELAAAYGENRARWPEETRALYDRFRDTPEAQLTLASAGQIDYFLNEWQPQSREDEVMDRILHSLPPQLAKSTPVRQWSLPAAILMLIALIGFGNGYFAADFTETMGRDMPAAFGMVEEE